MTQRELQILWHFIAGRSDGGRSRYKYSSTSTTVSNSHGPQSFYSGRRQRPTRQEEHVGSGEEAHTGGASDYQGPERQSTQWERDRLDALGKKDHHAKH